jgi:hypothetical protein
LPDIHRLVAVNRHIPFQEELLRLNPQCLSLLVLFTFVAAMMVKVSGTLMPYIKIPLEMGFRLSRNLFDTKI